jgi:acetoin utilization protein AcuC
MILNGEAEIVFHLAGGQHHSRPALATGFCIFGDVVLAIQRFLAHGWRVAYVDIDVHHADGVQAAFYDTDRVLTISLHESGRFLYPGTGFTDEVGEGAGRGYAVNLPFLPGTDDEVYLDAFFEIVPRLIENFAPEVLVAEVGTDAHREDPLAHLELTTRAFVEIARYLRSTNLKWLAMGGGGYNAQVAPRVWTLMFGEMIGCEFENVLPRAFGEGFLRDGENPRGDEKIRARAREDADARVRELCAKIPLLR